MTSLADFMVSDPLGQFAKVKEIRRQYESDYTMGADFWIRFREGIEEAIKRGPSRSTLATVHENAKNNRGAQYKSASDGFERFWGRRKLEVVAHPKPATWQHGRLRVRVNPEWILDINGSTFVVKLHLKERLRLDQRLANPLLHLLAQHFGPSVGGPPVAILDVHRGKVFKQNRAHQDLDTVVNMQAAAFVAGWEAIDRTVPRVA